jgi:penicillin-binding protein 1B
MATDPSKSSSVAEATSDLLGKLRELIHAAWRKALRAIDSVRAGDLRNTVLTVTAALFTLVLLIVGITFTVFYYKYKAVVDERLEKPLFTNTAKIYAAPFEVRLGQKLTTQSVVAQLRSAGYTEQGHGSSSPLGTYSQDVDAITVHPGPHSYYSQDSIGTISFAHGKVAALVGDKGQAIGAYELEPQLITGLSDANRGKRRLVTYDELPPQLVHAVVSIEDHRFFKHNGVDYFSALGWMWHDLRGDRRYRGGASTLTMQLSRGIFLSPERRLKRKIIETAITFQLENHYSKQKIFELYANQINLGHQGSFAINGFGQAAETYFGKEVGQLTLPECATLAGMIQHPSFLNPYHHPDRVIARRNVVLDTMAEQGYITKAEDETAKSQPLKLSPVAMDAGQAPYFVDLVRDQLTQKLGDTAYNSEGLHIYTSLDPDLQRAATDAVSEGMKIVDELVEKRRAKLAKAGSTAVVQTPQVALVALNPHTGQVVALVGGRDYGTSQLNHAVRNRPMGSSFKPFVFAAAFNSSLAATQLTTPTPEQAHVVDAAADAATGQAVQPNATDIPPWHGIFTAITPLNNDLQTFEGGYAPKNFHDDTRYLGQVSARVALQMSLNNATVELGQMVGFNNVAALARDAGIKSARGTPALALGAYGATPLEVAGAYTVFANNGMYIAPWMLSSVRTPTGEVLQDITPSSKPILDPRAAFLTTSLMQNVVNAGTGFEARRRGFMAPAAGKTGTENDAWFDGYTSNLLCIVWVGNDDYSDIKLQGEFAAVPIWAAFMKRAQQLPQYSDMRDFQAPAGVTVLRLDKQTNLIADTTCATNNFYAAFIDGTQPTQTCSQSSNDERNLFQKVLGLGEKPIGAPLPGQPQQIVVGSPAQPPAGAQQPAANANGPQPAEEPKKKKGFFGRLFGGGKKDQDQQQQQPQQPPPPQ